MLCWSGQVVVMVQVFGVLLFNVVVRRWWWWWCRCVVLSGVVVIMSWGIVVRLLYFGGTVSRLGGGSDGHGVWRCLLGVGRGGVMVGFNVL